MTNVQDQIQKHVCPENTHTHTLKTFADSDLHAITELPKQSQQGAMSE